MPNAEYQTLGQVAEKLGLPKWRLAHFIDRDVVPDASLRVPGRRLFSARDVAVIREILETRIVRKNKGTESREVFPR